MRKPLIIAFVSSLVTKYLGDKVYKTLVLALLIYIVVEILSNESESE